MAGTAASDRNYWFVGVAYGGTDDQLPRFVKEGIWKGGNEDRYVDLVKSIRVGDRIAAKSAYTRKRDLPFDNRGQTVSVMAIKAIGTVTENPGNGRRLGVDWKLLPEPREWYFFTGRGTVWRVQPGEWMKDALIAFAFEAKPQDITRFQNAPYWRERFGTSSTEGNRFRWTRFYEAMADRLLSYRSNRAPLVAAIHKIADRVDALANLHDKFADGSTGPLQDICPFTALGIFNRGIKESNRIAIAKELADFLEVSEEVPTTFEGIPILNNQKSWFFSYAKVRDASDINALWSVFASALEYADSDEPEARDAFVTAFDDATNRRGVKWNLTMGLYWIRPWVFAPLDMNSRNYIEKRLGIEIGNNGHKGLPSGVDYLKLLDSMEIRYREEGFPVHSFPEFSLSAWQYTDPAEPKTQDDTDIEDPDEPSPGAVEVIPAEVMHEVYTIDNIVADGCFLDAEELNRFLARLRAKKNLILQGPPGTGKTWLAKRLAFALMGERNEHRIRVLQFHPNMSYEDFVRGWRPSGDGKLSLVDGPLMEMIASAAKMPADKHVVVIEEINRGNPAQIFGEMFTLIEADKRNPSEAIELCHRKHEGERVFIPDNVYIIGTMNIADRSLALVDFALRRRFAFVELEPMFGAPWRKWVSGRCGVDGEFLDEIERRILALNAEIAADGSLGKAFRIGHSYVTPPVGIDITDTREWFIQVVDTEIGPLLEEYWFDAADRAKIARNRLIEGI